MRPEEEAKLRSEVKRLSAENAVLRQRLAQQAEQLTAVLARIAELEQRVRSPRRL